MNVHVSMDDLGQSKPKVRCRPIDESDLPAVTDLLSEGFPRRSRRYWSRALARMADRPVVDGAPRFGFTIAVGEQLVGCLLLIVSEQEDEQGTFLRANVSSWFVRPQYRFQASMLVSVAFRMVNATFLNISPAPHTVPILEAQGYRRFVAGQMITVPALARSTATTVVRLNETATRFDDLPEIALLRRHAGYGCIVLVCGEGDRREPFVFARRRVIRTIVPAAQLVWCRDVSAFHRHAGALGRYLLRYGIFSVACDANEPMPGLPGVYRDGNARKYVRGAHTPRLGDLADTELAVFGA